MPNHFLRLLVNDLVYWKFLPSPVLGFLASDLVFWVAGMAVLVVVGELRTEPRITAYRWLLHAAVTFVVSTGLFIVAHALVYSPPASRNEPGVVYHPSSAASNSFPSHHALLAALAVSWVVFARPRRGIPFVASAVICGWALVLFHSHYVIDVVFSWLLVVTGAGVAMVMTRLLGRPSFALLGPRLEAPRQAAARWSVLTRLLKGVAGGNQKLLAAKRRVRELKR